MKFAKAIGLIDHPQSSQPFTYSGTVFEILVWDVKLWFLIGWMLFWLILRHTGCIDPAEIPTVAGKYLGYNQAVLSFLLVFFLNSTYNEFKEQGRAAVAGGSPSGTAVIMAKVFFKHEPALQERVVRLVNAAHYLSWMDLAHYYSWTELLERGLLTKVEISALKSIPASKKSPIAMVWAMEEVAAYAERQERALEQWLALPDAQRLGSKPAAVHDLVMMRLIDSLNEGRSRYNALAICRSVQVPTIYTHMLFWLMTVFLLVLGFYAGIGSETSADEVADQSWWIGGYILVTLSFLGVFDVAMALREPFGIDSGLDIDPLIFVEGNMKTHKAILDMPTMLELEQPQKPSFDMFMRSKPAELAGDFAPAARGPSYVSTYKAPDNSEMRKMLSARLPKDAE
ncbi:hypothetical protein JKP88DRAFT_330676 [Tribonema minus]|uniref:Bestrophin homolog n=1 Tax=Tribonema minus TaxID=303371 RepID=A0A836C9Z5_9STRA|nr:hypothetical protein JKP88DRAFT_330676 [Tribonema minus]